MRPLHRRRWLVAASLLTVYVLLMTFGGCADRLILFPDTQPLDAGGAVQRLVPHSGGVVQVWTARSPALRAGQAPQGYVLEFTGNATRAEQIANWVAHRWRGQPVEVWVVNYPGYGGSTGPARLAAIPPAALAAYDALRREADRRAIYLAGNSLGTTAALYVASRRPVAGLMLQNPPPLRSLILGRYGWWNLWLLAGPIAMQVPVELDALRTGSKVRAPALFLLSDGDELVLPQYQSKVAEAYGGPMQVIRLRGGHNDATDPPSEAQISGGLQWLTSQGPR